MEDIFKNVGTSAPALLPLFRSKAQLAILGALYVGPHRYWTISSLAEYIGQPVSTTHREVARLDAAGIVTVTAEGRNRVVGPNWRLPWAGALVSLLDQTIGPLALLTEVLKEVAGLNQAWIFGSWAARHHGIPGPPPRDVDLLLVGDAISRFSVADATARVADRAGVELNPYFVSEQEWEQPDRGSFVAQVKSGPLVSVPFRDRANA
jgi:hypothetical protein